MTFAVDKGTKMGIELRMTCREPKQGCVAMQLCKQSKLKQKRGIFKVQQSTIYTSPKMLAVEAKGRQKAIELDDPTLFSTIRI
jgi:hypothetical protein